MESASPWRRLKRGDCTRGKNRAGVTTKLHLAITPDYRVVEGQLTGGNVADITMADALTAEIVGCYIVEDMGYDSDDHRQELRTTNNIPVIPGRKNRKVEIVYDKAIYRWRRRIEMFFGKLKENRRLAVRYEKTDVAFLGFIALAALKIHLC
jgi:transposase